MCAPLVLSNASAHASATTPNVSDANAPGTHVASSWSTPNAAVRVLNVGLTPRALSLAVMTSEHHRAALRATSGATDAAAAASDAEAPRSGDAARSAASSAAKTSRRQDSSRSRDPRTMSFRTSATNKPPPPVVSLLFSSSFVSESEALFSNANGALALTARNTRAAPRLIFHDASSSPSSEYSDASYSEPYSDPSSSSSMCSSASMCFSSSKSTWSSSPPSSPYKGSCDTSRRLSATTAGSAAAVARGHSSANRSSVRRHVSRVDSEPSSFAAAKSETTQGRLSKACVPNREPAACAIAPRSCAYGAASASRSAADRVAASAISRRAAEAHRARNPSPAVAPRLAKHVAAFFLVPGLPLSARYLTSAASSSRAVSGETPSAADDVM